MKKTYVYSTVIIILIWIILASLLDNAIILPSVYDVIKSMIKIVIDNEFYHIIFVSIIRTLVAVGISFLIAIVIATVSFFNSIFEDFFHIIYVILKTIPTIAIMIICLLWFGREGSVIAIVFLVVFPIMYSNILYAYKHIDRSLILNTKTYEDEFIIKLTRIYLPLIRSNLFESMKSTLSLGFKVTVMSELLSQVTNGIGKELYFAKINLLMSDIFAWTVIMVIISLIFDYILGLLIRSFSNE